jgi:hypothetical protein
MRNKIFLLGVNHFDWKLLRLMAKRADFRNLKALLGKASYGEMVPQQDLCSAPVEYTSIVTGVKKEKHTIGFGADSDKEYVKDGRIITSDDVKAKRLWEVFQENGLRVGVYHWLLTWPPKRVNGFLVGGRLSQSDDKVYPPGLRDALGKEEFEVSNRFVPKTALTLAKSFDIDLFVGMDEGAHGPNHNLWECVESESDDAYARTGKEDYFVMHRWLDEFIGMVEREFPESTIFIVTDSGMRMADSPVYCTGAEIVDLFRRLGIDLQLYAYDVYPPTLPKASPKVYVSGRSQRERIDILKMMDGVKIKAGGEKFFKDARWDGEYLLFTFNFQPSFVNHMSGNLELLLPDGGSLKLWITKLTGVSVPKGGAFIAKGPGIKENFDAGRVETIDIAPTVLHLRGIEPPGYMDGKVLENILK